MRAAVAGGVRHVEFTLNTEGAFDLIREFSAEEGLAVGAGTVLTPEEAVRACDQGAEFLVSPVVDEAVIREATRLGVPIIPGTQTPTEMLTAHQHGAPLQKLFPAPGTGPEFVRACLGPLPFLRIVPTHGVTIENAESWLDAGAYAVGFVASLFHPTDMASENYSAIESRASKIREIADRNGQ